MGERVLRGSRLGTTSYEADRNTDLAPRREAIYDCPHGHTFGVPLSSEADVPPTWDCRSCGATAVRRDAGEQEAKKSKHVRTHWDMLLERRSIDELEEVLAERLEELHAQQRGTRRTA